MSDSTKTENLISEVQATDKSIEKGNHEAEVGDKDKRKNYAAQEVDTKIIPSQK